MPRGECRICGRDSALNSDEQVRPHKGTSTTGLLIGGRCPGSGRPPADEPPCDHGCGRTAGRVSYPPDLKTVDLSQAHASTYVCFDPEHQREAALWVKGVTGHEGVFVGRESPAPAVQEPATGRERMPANDPGRQRTEANDG